MSSRALEMKCFGRLDTLCSMDFFVQFLKQNKKLDKEIIDVKWIFIFSFSRLRLNALEFTLVFDLHMNVVR